MAQTPGRQRAVHVQVLKIHEANGIKSLVHGEAHRAISVLEASVQLPAEKPRGAYRLCAKNIGYAIGLLKDKGCLYGDRCKFVHIKNHGASQAVDAYLQNLREQLAVPRTPTRQVAKPPKSTAWPEAFLSELAPTADASKARCLSRKRLEQWAKLDASDPSNLAKREFAKVMKLLQVTTYPDEFSSRPVDVLRKLLDAMVPLLRAIVCGTDPKKLQHWATNHQSFRLGYGDTRCLAWRIRQQTPRQYADENFKHSMDLEQLLSQLRQFLPAPQTQSDYNLRDDIDAMLRVRIVLFHRLFVVLPNFLHVLQELPKVALRIVDQLRAHYEPDPAGLGEDRFDEFRTQLERVGEVASKCLDLAEPQENALPQLWLNSAQNLTTLTFLAAPRVLDSPATEKHSVEANQNLSQNPLLRKGFSRTKSGVNEYTITDPLALTNTDYFWRALDVLGAAVSLKLFPDRQQCRTKFKSAFEDKHIDNHGFSLPAELPDSTVPVDKESQARRRAACGVPDIVSLDPILHDLFKSPLCHPDAKRDGETALAAVQTMRHRAAHYMGDEIKFEEIVQTVGAMVDLLWAVENPGLDPGIQPSLYWQLLARWGPGDESTYRSLKRKVSAASRRCRKDHDPALVLRREALARRLTMMVSTDLSLQFMRFRDLRHLCVPSNDTSRRVLDVGAAAHAVYNVLDSVVPEDRQPTPAEDEIAERLCWLCRCCEALAVRPRSLTPADRCAN
uniref:Uncharacterized protein n=1 Tax=Neobodo designis TaxID=312471 RepID=A0A7S1MJR3_NEODS|mmetsp:Transcript_41846/g.129315  ORF Transcript_41846/g.129315 Transcript_41846/m.129315 type:complete len:729 (+) Transcript_41846:28-2214(+)